jgi:hypothetical protein
MNPAPRECPNKDEIPGARNRLDRIRVLELLAGRISLVGLPVRSQGPGQKSADGKICSMQSQGIGLTSFLWEAVRFEPPRGTEPYVVTAESGKLQSELSDLAASQGLNNFPSVPNPA